MPELFLSRRPRRAVYLLTSLFIGAGVLHFLKPETYLRIMPPALPAPRLLVLLSGVAEVAGGGGLLVPATRRGACWRCCWPYSQPMCTCYKFITSCIFQPG